MIFNYFEDEKKLLYYEHGADEIPEEIIAQFSTKEVIQIDFSANSLMSLDCIEHFAKLKEVILDNNFLNDATTFPRKAFPNIALLSLNNNKFASLNLLVDNLVRCFPNIRYLSLLGNSLCPALHQDFNDEDYRAYRLSIISRLPKLKFLDAKRVDKGERPSSMQRSVDQQTTAESPEEKMEKLSAVKKMLGLTSRSSTATQSSSSDAYTPLPTDNLDSLQPSQKSVYGKVKNRYEGSQSQGNRFILNQDL